MLNYALYIGSRDLLALSLLQLGSCDWMAQNYNAITTKQSSQTNTHTGFRLQVFLPHPTIHGSLAQHALAVSHHCSPRLLGLWQRPRQRLKVHSSNSRGTVTPLPPVTVPPPPRARPFDKGVGVTNGSVVSGTAGTGTPRIGTPITLFQEFPSFKSCTVIIVIKGNGILCGHSIPPI